MASEKANMRNHIQALEKKVKELQERVYELEPCQRCEHQKYGSFGPLCEDCHFERLDEAHKDLGLDSSASDKIIDFAYKCKCEENPTMSWRYKEAYDAIKELRNWG